MLPNSSKGGSCMLRTRPATLCARPGCSPACRDVCCGVARRRRSHRMRLPVRPAAGVCAGVMRKGVPAVPGTVMSRARVSDGPRWSHRIDVRPVAFSRIRRPRGHGYVLVGEIGRSVVRRAEVFRTVIGQVASKCQRTRKHQRIREKGDRQLHCIAPQRPSDSLRQRPITNSASNPRNLKGLRYALARAGKRIARLGGGLQRLSRCFSLFFPEIISGRHPVFGGNPQFLTARQKQKQRKRPLFFRCFPLLLRQTVNDRGNPVTSQKFDGPWFHQIPHWALVSPNIMLGKFCQYDKCCLSTEKLNAGNALSSSSESRDPWAGQADRVKVG